MASFGRAIASGVTNVLEISPNLVSANFNFALYKIDAPAEFQGVGRALSHFRRAEAETGQPHVTARVLGALFESLLPKVPKLISLYGLRASEISQSPEINPSDSKNYGFFWSRVGADATTIWASATSGSGAIAVHLLACILARMWDPAEATSIWAEIVKQRRDDIFRDFEEQNVANYGDVSAARNTLSRQQLSEWDASARAWLHAADRVKVVEQKRLMLILDNISEQVNSSNITYDSVLRAWQNSLQVFEALLNGVSQKAKSGEILLALSAWHLYPDLMVVKPHPKTLSQKDPLLTSCGILTVGLRRAEEEQEGISWSLPLAQLRHYGMPVSRKHSFNSQQRLTLEEFSQVFLGAFLHGWGDRGRETEDMVHWLCKLRRILTAPLGHQEGQEDSLLKQLTRHGLKSWLGVLFDTSESCLRLYEAGDESFKQTLRLGRRCAETFLGKSPLESHFGLSVKGRFISCTKSANDRIKLLREFAAKLPGRPSQLFIRFRSDVGDQDSRPCYEYASAKPIEKASLKRRVDGSQQLSEVHCQWIHCGSGIRSHTDDKAYYRKLVKTIRDPLLSGGSSEAKSDHMSLLEPLDIISKCRRLIGENDPLDPRIVRTLKAIFADRSSRLQEQGEDVICREDCTIEDYEIQRMGIFWPDYPSSEGLDNPWFDMIYGDDSAALFADSDDKSIHLAAESNSRAHFRNFFDSQVLHPQALLAALQSQFASVLQNARY